MGNHERHADYTNADNANDNDAKKVKENELIMLAAYSDLETARTDFEEINTRIKNGLEVRAVALVSKDDSGKPTVTEAYNRHGRVAAGIGLGIGTLFGLFVPPMFLAMVVGAAVGAAVVSFAEHEMRIGLRKEIGSALENGTAVIVSLAFPNSQSPIESTLMGAKDFRVLPMDDSTSEILEETVAAEMREIAPLGRTGTSN